MSYRFVKNIKSIHIYEGNESSVYMVDARTVRLLHNNRADRITPYSVHINDGGVVGNDISIVLNTSERSLHNQKWMLK